LKKTRQTNIAVDDPYDTTLLDPHSLEIIHRNDGLKCFLPKCLFVVIVIYL